MVLLGVGIVQRLAEGGCFAAGTPIVTPDGLIPIEEIQPGDMVTSAGRTGGPIGRAVERTFHSRQDSWVDLEFPDETVTCTPNHRFYLEDWTPAHELRPGDFLVNSEGKRTELLGVSQRFMKTTAHNLRVQRSHTYFVGRTGLWVHNLKMNEPQPDQPDEHPDR
ncbi:Hint domain-containing protein [Streptomyces albiflavescens]|uniref:Hint domain-containing protein n=1 Tax=Streptomyces albiflavescens TaxID=1623582 RepID=UPI00166BE923|nr:Hint domain-containing protein [Streptomyces albiflavescens]